MYVSLCGGISDDLTELKDINLQVKRMDFSEFELSTCKRKYMDIEELPLAFLQAKHIIIRNEQTESIYQDAVRAGHTNIIWGSTRGGTINSEKAIIEKMIADNFRKSVRITITDNYTWSDNNHTTISYIRRGFKKVCEVPHYIIDCRSLPVRIIGAKEDIIWDHESIQHAIRNSFRLEIFDCRGGRKLSWTIENLMNQIYP